MRFNLIFLVANRTLIAPLEPRKDELTVRFIFNCLRFAVITGESRGEVEFILARGENFARLKVIFLLHVRQIRLFVNQGVHFREGERYQHDCQSERADGAHVAIKRAGSGDDGEAIDLTKEVCRRFEFVA